MSSFSTILVLFLSLFLQEIYGCGRPCSPEFCTSKNADKPCVVDLANMFDKCGCDNGACPQSTCGNCDIRGDEETRYAQCLRMCYEFENSDNGGCPNRAMDCETYCGESDDSGLATNFNEADDGFACIVSCPDIESPELTESPESDDGYPSGEDECAEYPDGFELNEDGECKCPLQPDDECETSEDCCDYECVELPPGGGRKICWLE